MAVSCVIEEGSSWLDGPADFSNEAVASARNIDDESISVLSIAQCPAQSGKIDGKISRFDKDIRPNASHQLLLGDQFAGALEQSNQDFKGATSKLQRLVAFQQKKLRTDQAKRSK